MINGGLSGSGWAAHPVDAAVGPRDVDIVMKPDRPVPLRAVRTQALCPVCGKPAHEKYQPFCSKRCADIDLGRWFKESYRVPTDETPADGE
jgi:endogenous inhibitor of DNA gyrase (YacG/DUF329 family)